jgi:hypothetical protein
MVMTMGTYQRSGDDVLQSQWGTPVGLAPSATWNNGSGNFTLDTALDRVYNKGIWFRFVGVGVNSSTGGPAASGLYWCVMNSTTEGQAYALPSTTTSTAVPVINLLAGSTFSFVPYIPLASQLNGLLPVTAGTHLPSTNAYIAVASVLIPGNLMGANGCIRVDSYASCNNSAATKAVANAFGGNVFLGSGGGTTVVALGSSNLVRNRGVTNAQVNGPIGTFTGNSASFLSVDTTVDQYAVILLNQGSANTDWMILQGATVEILPAA